MKVFIWFCCLAAFSTLQVLLSNSGVTLGAIPAALLFAGACWLAEALCNIFKHCHGIKPVSIVFI